MADPVKATRRYESPRRREQAEATRTAILDAAERLLLRDGYAATTMAAIAAEARVALKTVYVAFESKSGLLRTLWNHRLRAEDEHRPMGRHPGYLAVLAERDPERKLRMNARNSRLGKLRIGALAELVRSAAPGDAEMAALWERINVEYHANQEAIVRSLAELGALPPELDVARATDILWTLNHPSTWQLLVVQRGWTPEEYERWTADSACAQLLNRADDASAAPGTGRSRDRS